MHFILRPVLIAAIFVNLLSITCGQIAVAGNSHMAIMGDSGLIGNPLLRLQRSVQKAKIRSVIMPGDNLYGGNYENTWGPWLEAGINFDIVAIGNHNNGYKAEMEFFSMPSEFYSVIKNGARFIVLNSDNTKSVTTQMAWLDKELKNANEKLIFIIYHHPTFTITSDHTWNEKPEFQKHLRRIMKLYSQKITSLILGHDHISSLIDFGSTPAIVAGSGREVRAAKAVNYNEDGFLIKTQFLAPRTQHWADLEISEDGQEAWVHWIRVSDQKQVCTAHLGSGKFVLDNQCGRAN